MLRQIKLNAINAVVVKLQSHLYNVYQGENLAINYVVADVNAAMEELNTADIKKVAELSPEEIIARYYVQN